MLLPKNLLMAPALSLAIVLNLIVLSPVQAVEIKGVVLPEQVKVLGNGLNLNGTGVRQVTIFHVDVYAAGLYLQKLSHDPEEIVKSTAPKSLEMVFLRGVDAKDIAKAWDEGFEKNCIGECESLKPGVAQLKTFMADMKKGDRMAYNFLSDRVEVMVRGKVVGTIDGPEFSRNMLRIWLGKSPPNESLKKGLLGLKD
jgi:hypothetical protein